MPVVLGQLVQLQGRRHHVHGHPASSAARPATPHVWPGRGPASAWVYQHPARTTGRIRCRGLPSALSANECQNASRVPSTPECWCHPMAMIATDFGTRSGSEQGAPVHRHQHPQPSPSPSAASRASRIPCRSRGRGQPNTRTRPCMAPASPEPPAFAVSPSAASHCTAAADGLGGKRGVPWFFKPRHTPIHHTCSNTRPNGSDLLAIRI